MSAKTATQLHKLAAATVACYRDEFPGQAPDWSSDWWTEAWSIDGHPGEFADYLAACKSAWSC